MQMMTQEGSVMTHCYWKVNYNFARGRRFIVLNGDKGGEKITVGLVMGDSRVHTKGRLE